MNEIFEFSGLGNKILILDLLKQDIEVNPKLIRKLKSLRTQVPKLRRPKPVKTFNGEYIFDLNASYS